nr:cell division protein ZapA [Thiocystis violacea]
MQVSIRILEKEYRIACAYHEQDDLRASARLLDSRMREIRQTGRVIGTDRIAVMAALNIAHDLIQLQRSRAGDEDPGKRLRQLQERINSALAGDREETFDPAASDAPYEADDSETEITPPHLDAPDERV